LILRKIIKIVATRGQIFPDSAGGAYSTPPDPLAGFGALLLRGGEGRGRGEGREGKGRGGA